MKAFERIFLYTVLAILVFYVFLVDGNVESRVAIQEEILARRIAIVNDAGQEVVGLWANEDGGVMVVNNKDGKSVALISAARYGGFGCEMTFRDKNGWLVELPGLLIAIKERVFNFNIDGEMIDKLP